MLSTFTHLPLKENGSSVCSCLKAFCTNFVLGGPLGDFDELFSWFKQLIQIFGKKCALLQGSTEYESRWSQDSIAFDGLTNAHFLVELQQQTPGPFSWCYQVLLKKMERICDRYSQECLAVERKIYVREFAFVPVRFCVTYGLTHEWPKNRFYIRDFFSVQRVRGGTPGTRKMK